MQVEQCRRLGKMDATRARPPLKSFNAQARNILLKDNKFHHCRVLSQIERKGEGLGIWAGEYEIVCKGAR